MTAIEKSSGAITAVSDRNREVRRVAAASLVGTTIEWYDFLIYATMAGVIFNQYFFPKGDAFVNTMLAYGTFAAGFLIRPFGGLLFGHFGDRIGRKPLLVLTLMIMGVATCLIGLLPTYDTIGIWAPILLLTLRLIQGIALGGEWGGAVLMSYEFAKPEERAYYASFPQIGLAVGLCLSTGVVIASACIVVVLGVIWAFVYGPQAAMFCDLFDTRVRYTGVSLVYQVGAIFSVSLTPLAATALLQANNNQPWLIATYVSAAGVISAICAALMKRVP